ncbi:hypothetical protein PSPO01_03946 [Paraphaeosphaeria sporulosa]
MDFLYAACSKSQGAAFVGVVLSPFEGVALISHRYFALFTFPTSPPSIASSTGVSPSQQHHFLGKGVLLAQFPSSTNVVLRCPKASYTPMHSPKTGPHVRHAKLAGTVGAFHVPIATELSDLEARIVDARHGSSELGIRGRVWGQRHYRYHSPTIVRNLLQLRPIYGLTTQVSSTLKYYHYSAMSSPEKVEKGGESPERVHIPDVEKTDSTWNDPADIPVELDKRITRKLDKRLMPWLFGLWLLAFIDRSNIGNAKIDGMVEDLRLDSNKFNIALAVFYVPYILWDVPSNLVIKHLKAGYYLPGILIAWGLVSMCTGFVKSYAGLLVARFFLGLAEGGLLGGMLVYLAMFYRRHQMLYRITLFYCAVPLSGAFGGLLATGLAKIQTGGYNGWVSHSSHKSLLPLTVQPFIFFVEGAITVVFGIAVLFFLPHTPSDIKFFSADEKRACIARMRLDAHGATAASTVGEERFDWYWVRRALLNVNTIVLSIVFFAIITPIYSFSLFLPTIIRSMGYSRVTAQLFTVPPNMGAFFIVLLTGWGSDKWRMRGPLMLVGCTVAIVGYIMLIASERSSVQYGGTFLVAAGIFPCSPLVMGWLSNNLAPHYVRATGTGFQIMIANMAAFIATFTYLPEDAPRYTTGHAINIGMLGLALISIAGNIWYCRWENKKRATGQRDYRLRDEKEERLGYRHPRFEYTI